MQEWLACAINDKNFFIIGYILLLFVSKFKNLKHTCTPKVKMSLEHRFFFLSSRRIMFHKSGFFMSKYWQSNQVIKYMFGSFDFFCNDPCFHRHLIHRNPVLMKKERFGCVSIVMSQKDYTFSRHNKVALLT